METVVSSALVNRQLSDRVLVKFAGPANPIRHDRQRQYTAPEQFPRRRIAIESCRDFGCDDGEELPPFLNLQSDKTERPIAPVLGSESTVGRPHTHLQRIDPG
jgi:hypothetical protein